MPTAIKADGTSLRPEAVTQAPNCQPATTVTDSQLALHGPLAPVIPFMAPLRGVGQLGTRDDIQQELDGIAFAVRSFHLKQPDMVMKETAAYAARLTELCVLLHRVEATDRQYTRVRTQQVEKWLSELDRQFKIASRLVEVARQDLALLGGQI